jgi:hypothetical protein
MRHGHRTSVRAAAAVGATTVVTIAAVTIVTIMKRLDRARDTEPAAGIDGRDPTAQEPP